MKNQKSTRRGKAPKMEVLALAAKDSRSYMTINKREPHTYISKFIMIGGVPHKFSNGVMVPLTKKA
jgi:hypothetical protein